MSTIPKMIHFDKWWKYSDLLCLNHLEMKTYKWCGPFPVLISYKNPNRRLRFQSSKFENGFYQWRNSAVHCCIRLIRIKIINCLYSQNPFSNFWLRHLICCYRHCVYIGVLSLKKVQFNLKESILMAAKRCICAVKSSWCVS